MNKIKNALVTTSLVCLMLVGTALADDMKHHQTVTFDKEVMINNTLLKKGTYRVTFDVQKSEVKFRRSTDRDVVVVVPARIETMANKAKHDAITLSETEAGMVLQKLVFEGHKEAAVIQAELNAEISMVHTPVPTNNNFSEQDWLYQEVGSYEPASEQVETPAEEFNQESADETYPYNKITILNSLHHSF